MITLSCAGCASWPLCGARAQRLAPWPRCRLEQVRYDPGVLVALGALVDVHGGVVEGLAPADYQLFADGQPLGGAAQARAFRDAQVPLSLAVLVADSVLTDASLPVVQGGLKTLLRGLPAGARVRLYHIGEELQALAPPASAGALLSGALSLPGGEEGPPQLLNGLRGTLDALMGDEPRGGAAPRRVVVVITDGRSVVLERALVSALGQELRERGVPLYSVGVAPPRAADDLIHLGELSRRSAGTFRWVRSLPELPSALESLARELSATRVLLFRGAAVTAFARRGGVETQLFLRCGAPAAESERLRIIGRPHALLAEAEGVSQGLWSGLALLSLGALVLVLGRLVLVRGLRRPRPAPAQPSHLTLEVIPQARPGPVLLRADGAQIALGSSLRIGASVSGPNTLHVGDDTSVSGEHCLILEEHGAHAISDCRSTNGTFVNGHRIQARTRLRHGDLIRIGERTTLTFVDPAPVA